MLPLITKHHKHYLNREQDLYHSTISHIQTEKTGVCWHCAKHFGKRPEVQVIFRGPTTGHCKLKLTLSTNDLPPYTRPRISPFHVKFNNYIYCF